jgi:N-succinyldiaminopimelate aminotransferase
VPLRPEPDGGRFALDPAELAAAISPRTRLILVNSPHNPTGTVLTAAELEAVADLCRTRDLIAVTDEVYEHLTFDGTRHLPLATLADMRDRTVSISSAGKTFSVTGWKIGWVCAPEPLVRAISTVHQFLTFTHSGPLQLAVADALDHETAWVEDLRRSLESRRDRLATGLEAAGFAVHRPQATYFVLADGRSLGFDDGDVLARRMPTEVGVVGIPVGGFCDHPEVGRAFVRFTFCKRDDVLDDAVARLTAWSGGTGRARL